jgi:hypothetical protein
VTGLVAQLWIGPEQGFGVWMRAQEGGDGIKVLEASTMGRGAEGRTRQNQSCSKPDLNTQLGNSIRHSSITEKVMIIKLIKVEES